MRSLAMCKELRGEVDEARALRTASLEQARAGDVAASDLLDNMCHLAQLHVLAAD